MAEQPAPERPIILATLPDGPFDTDLGGEEAAPTPPAADDALRLPRGGLVALRRSGGLRFTVREVVVYGDGRIATDGNRPPRRAARCLSEAEMGEVWTALAASELRSQTPVQGQQRPDAYAYELVARLGGRTYATEAFDGSIPAPLAPLIALLLRLRPTA